MASPDDITRLRTRRDAALAAALAAQTRMQTHDTAIAQAERAGDRELLSRLRTQREGAGREAAAARTEHTTLRGDAFDQLIDWAQQTPEQVVSTLNDAYPFVMLPVRMETKFSRGAAATELHVRLYPDDVAISSPPPPLTEEETNLGQDYWRVRATSRQAPGDDAALRSYKGAWQTLAARSGPLRAGFVVRATVPENPDAAAGDLSFAPAAVAETPPVTRSMLPDRFVVMAFNLDPTTRVPQEIVRAVGAPIPDDLALAPDPAQQETWITRDASSRIVIPDALKWMVEFGAAEQSGMAVRLPLSPPHDTAGFDRLVAIGIRSATPPTDGPAAIETLFANHRDTRGMDLVRAGTPTNNSDTAVSGWQTDNADDLFEIEDSPRDLTPVDGLLGTSDGWRVADLFALSTDVVRRFPNAIATDVAEAMAMNRALGPGTIDDFVREFLKGLVGKATAQELHRFFVTWVSGRGHYPALRVGRQPYGVVLTGPWRNWSFPPQDGRTPDIAQTLHGLMLPHRLRWENLARLAPHAAADTGNGFQRLLAILGQLASSTDFVSRKAVSDQFIRERLKFGGADQAAIQQWFSWLQQTRTQSLAATNFPPTPGPTDPLIAFIVFLRETQAWLLPLVDRDPKVPLSENDPVGPYDGTHNYLWWLATAARADLAAERFIGADGNAAPRPTALLYVLLRYALLAAVETGSLETATQVGSRYFSVIERDPLIANIGDEQHILRRDYLSVDVSRLGLTATQVSLADWTLAAANLPHGQRPPTVDTLAEAREAISALADLPTARLERLMAEHLDLCSYRLDGWITALYAQRLAQMRNRSDGRGLHLGAFGFVENLRPAVRQRLQPDALPEALREGIGPNIFSDDANGGFIHAPSLTQAATAAILRNGYLSHAEPQVPQRFSVNLSSARTRAAQALAQGVREGQPLGALLGYQLERGLHEGHPGVELDVVIGALRDNFPLLSGRLTDLPPGVSAETIEARNVVDGLALVEATKGETYPYGVTGLPASSTAEAVAVIAEIHRLHDAVDALSDVLLAESVHQAVQGNLARTKAALDALTSPDSPPEPEIVRTPRSGRVLSFRATLTFDASATTGWRPELSPRARANPQINHWLSQHLPPADSIQWTVTNGGAPPSVQTFQGMGLEPIDIVLMSGDRLGDQSSELERFLINRYRIENAVPDDRTTVVAPQSPSDPAAAIVFDFAAAEGGSALAAVLPAVARLRRIITRSRPLHAGDWRRSADPSDIADPTGSAQGDPRLVDFTDLKARLDKASANLAQASDALKAAADALAPLQAALDADPATISDPAWIPALADVRTRLMTLLGFGISEALPGPDLKVSPVLVERLASLAQVVVAAATTRLAQAAGLRAMSFTEPLPADEPDHSREIGRRNDILRTSYYDAAKALLGPSFVITPLFKFAVGQANEINAASAVPRDPLAIEEWMQSVARVRPGITDMVWALATTRWCGRAIADPKIVQLPHSPGAPFIGGAFGQSQPPGEVMALVALNADALAATLQTGLLLDEWTETVPTDRETTGIAFNINRPNATAPQAILVAVPASFTGHWSFEDLISSVHEALDLAKLRAVEPDGLLGRSDTGTGDYFQLLPAVLTEFSTGRFATVDFADRVASVLRSSG